MEHYEAKRKFGTVTSITIEALGEPGQRTFRMLLESTLSSACLWLEKEQLQHVATYIQEVSEGLSHNQMEQRYEGDEKPQMEDSSDLEFKVGKLALGHDGSANSFLFLAHDVASDDNDPPDLAFSVSLGRAQQLAKETLEVCAAGRPLCFLCGQPVNLEGHMCVRSNGHQSIQP